MGLEWSHTVDNKVSFQQTYLILSVLCASEGCKTMALHTFLSVILGKL